MFFQQAIGRFVRTRGDETDVYPAQLFLPATSTFKLLATEMERERDHVLRELDEEVDDLVVVDSTGQSAISLIEPLAAEDAEHLTTVSAGDEFSPEELAAARAYIDQSGARTSETDAAKLLRAFQSAAPGTPANIALSQSTALSPPATPPAIRRQELKKRLNTAVRSTSYRLAAEASLPMSDVAPRIWTAVHQYVGQGSLAEYSVDDLEAGITFARCFEGDEDSA